ncbi:MAG: LpqB family beta-propeller domain-containing protein [Microbacterium sp.]
MRRTPRAVVCVLLALALAGCAGLPTSGSVQAGESATSSEDEPSFDFRPDGPQTDASPEQIVDGFITAASSPEGTSADGSWAIARSFLATDYRADWNPQASVVVDVFADRQYTVADDGTVSVQVTPVATVDDAGTYTPTEGGTITLTYRLAQQEDGQWRIVDAPAGLLMDEDLFASVFHSYEVMYFDPTWTYLVPDVRWFPTVNAVGRIATALVNGTPASWLAASVVTAFPAGVTLTPAVPVSGGVAQAELSDEALSADDLTLKRMQTQLSASLATAGVTSVQMLVDGSAIDASTVTTASTKVDATRPLVLGDAGFGFLSSGTVTTITGLSDAVVALAPSAIETAADLQSAAVLAGGSAVRVLADGSTTVVDSRAGVLAPTIDPSGNIWSVPSGTPSAVQATTTAGTVIAIAGAWSGATAIGAMQVSRDGTRMAAVVSYGSTTVLAVAGVIRDTDGTPSALGEPVVLAQLPDGGVDVGWLDDASVGVVSAGTTSMFLDAPVGGAGDTLSVPVSAVSLAGTNSEDSVRLLGADGSLYMRRSSTWVEVASGVTVLAVQQGSPG